jgi:hypothetical protein
LLSAAASSEHLREDVAHAATTAGLSIDSVFTMLVIHFTLFRVAQDVVGS